MPVLTGTVISNLKQADVFSFNSPNLQQYLVNNYNTVAWRLDGDLPNGTKTNTIFKPTITSKSGVWIKGIWDYYYNRIHINPGVLALGNITNTQQRTFRVWNAYQTTKELSSVTEVTLNGCVLTGATTKTYQGYEEAAYIVSVANSGAASFSGYYQFNFPSETPKVYISGSRVVSLPFMHNFMRPIRESLEFKTDVIRSKNGTEKRIRIRNRPRRRLEYEVLLSDARTRALFESIIFGWQNRSFAVPIWSDKGELTGPVSAGSNTIPVSTTYRDYDVGSLVYLWKDAHNFEVLEIQSFTSISITTVTSVQGSYDTGCAVTPGRIGILSSDVQVQGLSSSIAQARLSIDILTSEKSTNRLSVEAETLYKGIGVFNKQSNYIDGIQIDILRDIEYVDFETGPILQYSPTTGPTRGIECIRNITGRLAISQFLNWINSKAGRLNPIWVLGEEMDFEITQNVTSTQVNFICKDINFTRFYCDSNGVPHPSRRDIGIVLNNGTILYRRILTAVSNGNGTETINLDAQFGGNYTVSDIARISFLKFCRLDADITNFEWLSNETLRTSFKFRELLTSP
jgi:hypothetical protein